DLDDALGRAHAVLRWRGGDARLETEFASGVDSLVVYGSDEAVAAWAAYAPRRRIGHGHRASIAGVRAGGGAVHAGSLPAAAALDVALYDQLGCLSPQALFTLGADRERHRVFVDRVGEALQELERRMPRGLVPEEHALGMRRWRDEFEWREIGGGDL